MKAIWWILWMLAAGIEYLAGYAREACDRKIKPKKDEKEKP